VSGIEPVSYARCAHDFDGFAHDLGASFRRWGFAVICDHGLDEAAIARALNAAKAFFALPDDVKRRWHAPGTGGARGYTPFGVETAKGARHHDLKEFWHVGRNLPDGHAYRAVMPDNLWPDEAVASFQAHVQGLYDALDAMGLKVLHAVARSLGLADGFFDDKVRLGNSVLRLLHYPPVSGDPLAGDSPHVRAGAHEDINVITLLLGAEEAGLEVKDRDGAWIAINPPPGALVCNIGDMLQRLTNHVLPSTTHRVVNPAPERRGFPRYSTPFFLHFQPDFLIETLPGCVSTAQPDRYPEPITADAYLQARLREIRLK
jgi:isopenicillin N synthase-like dioxygenase